MTAAVLVLLAFTSLGAATVNGALGYGYSSMTVPVALTVVPGRVLNPALVIVEVIVNACGVVWNRSALRRVIRRVIPLALGLLPGVVLGALLLGDLASNSVRIVAFVVLLPLILLQAAGKRWPIRDERRAAVPLGGAVGVMYGLTTISGPPLALFWKNQQLAKEDFRVALALIRTLEATCALVVYAWLGLFVQDSASLLPWLAPGILIGFPLGRWLVRKFDAETFRRVCTSFDAYLVAFGLAHALVSTGVPKSAAYQLVLATAVLDTRMLWTFFRASRATAVAKNPALLEAA